MANPQFRKGMEVEVCSSDEGLRGSWFAATIVRSHLKKKRQVLLEYKTLMADEAAGSKPLREFVDVLNVRPIPPRDLHPVVFNSSDEVDAYHNDAWWEGVVTKVLENSRYLVYFRVSKEEIEFGHSHLRTHREWAAGGSWVPPFTAQDRNQNQNQNQDIAKEINHMDDSSRAESLVLNTAGIAYQSNTKKLEIVRPPPESHKSKILSPCEKNKKRRETTNTTSFIAHPEIAVPTTPNTNGKEAPLQKHKEISKTLSDIFSSPSDVTNVNLASSSGQEKIGSVLDFDKSRNLSTVNDFSLSSLSNENGEQFDSSEGKCLQKNIVIQPQLHCEKETPKAPTTNGEEEPLQKKEVGQRSAGIFSSPSEGLSSDLAPSFSREKTGNVTDLSPLPLSSNEGESCDHLAPNFSQLTVGSILVYDQSGSHPTNNDFSLSTLTNNEGEQCDSFKAQVQCIQSSLLTQSPPYITTKPDPQRCRRVGTGWRCPEMASPGKQHCEKHLLEQNIRNEKRRNMPKEQFRIIMEPFIPSDHQRCRRTGKGWRCPVMASQGKRYCENHQLKQNLRNEKRRKRPLEQIQFHMEPFLPSEPHQCRRTGKGWRCSAMTSSGKRYCDKHQLEQNIHNEKRRKKRKELVTGGNDERSNSSGDHLLQQCGSVDFDAKYNQGDAEKADKTLLQVSNPLVIDRKHHQDDTRKSDQDTDANCNEDDARNTDPALLSQDDKTIDIEANCSEDDTRETDQSCLNHAIIGTANDQTKERGIWNHPWMSFSDATRSDQGHLSQDCNNADMYGKRNQGGARKHPSQFDNNTASINMGNDQMQKRGMWNHPWISFSQGDVKKID